MSMTTDPNDPRLTRGVDNTPTDQAQVYLVLSEEERAKGFVRPYRDSYVHVGDRPRFALRDLTDEERERFAGLGYVAFEAYPAGESSLIGRYWTRAQLDNEGCRAVTTMAPEIAETYARDPHFYGTTYCVRCRKHLPVAEFEWEDGSKLGS